MASIWATFVNTWATFLLQYLVTLDAAFIQITARLRHLISIKKEEENFAKRSYLEKMRIDISWWIRQSLVPGGFSGPSYARFMFSEKDKWGRDKWGRQK